MSKIRNSISAFDPNTSVFVKVLIVLIVVVLTVLMFPKGQSIEFEYRLGSIWVGEDIIAPFSFPIYKDDRQYERELEEAERSVYPVFKRDDRRANELTDSLRYFIGLLQTALDFESDYFQKREAYREGAVEMREEVERDSMILADFKNELPIRFTNNEWQILRDFHAGRRPSPRIPFTGISGLEREVVERLREIFRTGIINIPKLEIQHSEIALRRDVDEVVVPVNRYHDMSGALMLFEQSIITDIIPEPEAAQSLAIKMGSFFLRPNIIYDKEETERLIQIARDEVPRTIGFVLENERIISRHERITEDTKSRLDSFRRAKAERGGEINLFLQHIGKGLHVSLILLLYGVYFFLFRKKIFHNNGKLALIALIILMQAFFAYLSQALTLNVPIEYLILVPAASMLLVIMFDSRLAFYGTVVIAALVGGIRGNDYNIMIVSLIGGALAAYTVRDIRHRSQIFRSMGFIFLGYSLAILALGLERFERPMVMLQEMMFAGTNALLSPVLTFGLLIFFERVWRITTDLTLLELSDFNHPLLKDLSQKAPGTFHHSLVMGSLAETAAEAIGANTILARVGAYYHDIGKALKPEYFVENQMGFKNRHDKLTPHMSALIIVAHVKDGIELGKKHKLPKEIIDFMPMHHGTTLISYFYTKAVDQQTDKDEINEMDYRYPGPKPQTKETGIVMLADAVEAATRSIEDPSIPKLKATIENIIKTRFEEGELDECELTLKDLTKIREAFFKVLAGIHHPRVKYPGQEKMETSTEKDDKQLVLSPEEVAKETPAMPPEETARPQRKKSKKADNKG